MKEKPDFTWLFYSTPAGGEVVRREINDVLGDGPPKKELGALMARIAYGRTLPRDTKALGGGLIEARLTDAGNEYRLYYTHDTTGDCVLLSLAFAQKGSRGAQDRTIAVARDRLADWRGRI
ncbi:type II toxin-antitoxin system RelE/ParE family toxin [Nonomuraea sp. NPDC050536]|uniref:type II toxin-antitoxin system RelE/ParE family toxin n=1 Tax=Nonomuraea sp. NPDC050536 TaxID=3364366 RepID=UPI0037C6C0E7